MNCNTIRNRPNSHFVFFPLLLLLFIGTSIFHVSAQEEEPVKLYYFYQFGCPMCEKTGPFLRELSRKYPELNVVEKDVGEWEEEKIAELYDMADKFGIESVGVPAVFLGDQYWLGYSEQISREIEEAVNRCIEKGCIDAKEDPLPAERNAGKTKVDTGIFGTVNLSELSLVPATVLIALLDGVNPCSVWVLTFLLGMLLHTGSRRKIIFAGIAFLFTTAAVYGLFIVGVVKVLGLLSFTRWIRYAVALLAVAMGAINVKDFFTFKRGVSLTISGKNRRRIGERLRRLVSGEKSAFALAAAAVFLAGGISLVELPCTAGFPVIWSNLITSADTGSGAFTGLLILYLLIYLVDELVIFSAGVIGFKRISMEEKHGRYLKLFGGTVLISLAAVMIINPVFMESLWSTLLVFAAAAFLALVLILIKRLKGKGL